MKLKTKLIIAFLTVLLLPIILGTTLIFLLGAYQISTIEKTYKISGDNGGKPVQFHADHIQPDGRILS